MQISNENLAKILNLWTETDNWYLTRAGTLRVQLQAGCTSMQRSFGGYAYEPALGLEGDKVAYELMHFMLKDRPYRGAPPMEGPATVDVSPELYVRRLKEWEHYGGNIAVPGEAIDHAQVFHYGQAMTSECLAQIAHKRWPHDGWVARGGSLSDNRYFYGGEPGELTYGSNEDWPGWEEQRAKLVNIVVEFMRDPSSPDFGCLRTPHEVPVGPNVAALTEDDVFEGGGTLMLKAVRVTYGASDGWQVRPPELLARPSNGGWAHQDTCGMTSKEGDR